MHQVAARGGMVTIGTMVIRVTHKEIITGRRLARITKTHVPIKVWQVGLWAVL
jgi:hypothetical protein